MLTAVKEFLKAIFVSAPMLYFISIVAVLTTIFKKAEWGLFVLIVMIPLPTLWYKLHQYPMGKDFMDVFIFAILMGILYQHKGFAKTPNSTLIIIFMIISYVAVWNSSLRFYLPLPITNESELLKDWKNYAEMIFLYFLVLNVIKDEDQQKKLVTLMSIIVLLIAIRGYRNFYAADVFNYGKRFAGPFEKVGLNPNHFGAFIAYTSAFFLGLAFFDKDKRRKLLLIMTVLFSIHPLFFSYSRGAYVAAFGTMVFFGITKKRTLLLLCIVLILAWQTVLPASVVDRISMTESASGEIEASGAHRLDLWHHAMGLFKSNPVFGIGFGGFGFTVPEGELTDTHNLYMKMLSEQGIIGITLLLLIFMKAFLSGWRLSKISKTPFQKGLGFGFMGAIIALMLANLFGDRWSFFALGGYFWIFWALVDRGIIVSKSTPAPEQPGPSRAAQLVSERPPFSHIQRWRR
jgi:O-antigen ligase